jgi:hypothetical protein
MTPGAIIARKPIAVVLICALIVGALTTSAVDAADPRLEPGQNPAGTPVAIISEGVDYTRAEIARVLARDGEGEAIAWDTADGDHRPFAKNGAGTAAVLAATARGSVRIIPIRITEGDRPSLVKAITFAANTPARIVLAPLSDKARAELEVLVAAAQKFIGILFVTSLPKLTEDDKKNASSAPNLVLLEAHEAQLIASERIAYALGCGNGDLPGESGAEKKGVFLSRLETRAKPDGQMPAACETKAGSKGNHP